jgi:sodium/potassium-transporting ATPase subunit alpha
MSIHVETMQEKQSTSKRAAVDPASAIRQIDVHLLTPEQIFTRFSASPTLGLEDAAVQRRSKNGKNVISPPPTHYWKKALNYIFGGFNFLMWIAFLVTIVCD